MQIARGVNEDRRATAGCASDCKVKTTLLARLCASFTSLGLAALFINNTLRSPHPFPHGSHLPFRILTRPSGAFAFLLSLPCKLYSLMAASVSELPFALRIALAASLIQKCLRPPRLIQKPFSNRNRLILAHLDASVV